MKFNDFFEHIYRTISPVRSLFGLYILMYLLPIILPFYIAVTSLSKLILSDGSINSQLLTIVSVCSVTVLLWTIFFLIYFTKIRTKNPNLYGKTFVSEFRVSYVDDKYKTTGNDKYKSDQVT